MEFILKYAELIILAVTVVLLLIQHKNRVIEQEKFKQELWTKLEITVLNIGEDVSEIKADISELKTKYEKLRDSIIITGNNTGKL